MKIPQLHVVIGLGSTGLSCVRFLTQRNTPVVVMDTRSCPPNLEQFRLTYPDIPVYTGMPWPQKILSQATTVVVSPGVSLSLPAIQSIKAQGVDVIGDIELFARMNPKQIIAITGANGKSTVTTLIGEMIRMAGKKVAVVGNIGTPVLDLFQDNSPCLDFDFIVMELSSFQLESLSSLQPLVSTVLNITPDHLDRYECFADYVHAKHRIHHNAKHVIINKQDPLSSSNKISATAKRWYYSLETPDEGEFGVLQKEERKWLAIGKEPLLPIEDLNLMGQHNIANSLSALAIGMAIGLDKGAMLQSLKNFTGLAHRCQRVAYEKEKNIYWINDSKGTNIGACQAAIKGLGQQISGKIVLLLGGDSKGADFSTLADFIVQYCRAIIVMGKDAALILAALDHLMASYQVSTMQEAVKQASLCAQPGDIVLLSPACSSLDQYQNFSHRGEIFMQAVKTNLGDERS